MCEYTNINDPNETVTDKVNDGITLTQRKKGLKFGTDALFLAAYIPEQKKPRRAAELGSGTGIISLLILQRNKASRIFDYEVQPTYAELTQYNADQNNASECMTVLCKDVRDASPADCGGELDIVVSNPPYLSADAGLHCDASEKNIARREICGDIKDFVAAASRLLRYGGYFYVVYRPERITSLLSAMRASALEPKRITFVHEHPGAEPCLILCEARKGSGEGLKITKPLFIRPSQTSSEYTEETEAIYSGKPLTL